MPQNTAFTLALIALAVFSVLLWWLPKLQVRSARWRLKDTEPPMAENEFRKTLAQVLGGLFVLGGFLFTWTELRQTAERTQEQLRILESGQITERYSRAIEQLASGKLEERLGGIYSLERIALDSADDHWTVMEVLTAFVRERSPVHLREELTAEELEDYRPPEDLQAALTAIGRRQWEDMRPGREGEPRPGEYDAATDSGGRLNLSGAFLRSADLRWAHLAGAELYSSDLTYSDLEGADLTGARLGDANLCAAFLPEAVLVNAILSGASLEEAWLPRSDFREAFLEWTVLSGTRLLEAANLTQDQLDDACADGRIWNLPPGLEQPRPCNLDEEAALERTEPGPPSPRCASPS